MGSAHAQALAILNKRVIAGAIKPVCAIRSFALISSRTPEFKSFRVASIMLEPHIMGVVDILRAGRGTSREFRHDARPLRGAGGFKGCERGGHQERLSPAREKIAPGCQQARSQSCHAL